MLPYKIISPTSSRVPIVISVPHCGVQFPSDIKNDYKQDLIKAPDDTDWFVDQLYDFAPGLGMTMITAEYSRWVIDVNRDPESKPLYTDGRIITALCPATTFLGEPIYTDHRNEVSPSEVKRRLDTYYWPYHNKIQELLTDLKNEFGQVLLWDCHSIRQFVKTIQAEKFPDLILGTVDEKSADAAFISSVLKDLGSSTYQLQHNHPFKGGFITRYFGKPLEKQHALQLEMAKVNYMNDSELTYNADRANKMRTVLQKTLSNLSRQLIQ